METQSEAVNPLLSILKKCRRAIARETLHHARGNEHETKRRYRCLSTKKPAPKKGPRIRDVCGLACLEFRAKGDEQLPPEQVVDVVAVCLPARNDE